MLTKNVEKLINDQITFEYYSAYIYFAMAAHFKSEGLNGFANWMTVQTQEELCHGTGLYNYLIQRGGKVELQAIKQPPVSWKSPLAVFEHALEHENIVTSRIDRIAEAAAKDKDFATSNFIQWYVGEQVEEEANVTEIINELKMLGDAKAGLIMKDRELGQRTFAIPAIPGGGLAAAKAGPAA